MEEWGLVLIFLVFLILLILTISAYDPDSKPSWWTRYGGRATFDDFSNRNDGYISFDTDSSSGNDSDSSGGDSSGGDSSGGDSD